MMFTNKWTPKAIRQLCAVRVVSILLVVVLLLTNLTACNFGSLNAMSNEKRIENRIEKFVEAYNSGDMEAVLESLDAKTRSAFQGMLNLLGGVAENYAGINVDLSELFNMGISTAQGELQELEITSTKLIDETTADVATTMEVNGVILSVYFHMVYEDDGWYISDITDNTISPTSYSRFVDGVAVISYTVGDVDYGAIINEQGEIIYSTVEPVKSLGFMDYGSLKFSLMGDGATIISQLKENSYTEYTAVCIIDKNGNEVASFEDEMELICGGDGLALLYQCKESVDSVEHLLGVIDSTGKWVQPLADFGCKSGVYCNEGIFGLFAGNNYYGGANRIFIDSNTGDTFYISGLNKMVRFTNGVAFVYGADKNSRIISPYDKSEEVEGVDAPKYYLLYSDGTYEEYSMDGKTFKGYSDGYLWYTVDGDENNVYIEDITTSDNNSFIYDQYPASMVDSVSFDGDYGLVIIKGADGNRYFTLIDKNGNQQFEPIETNYDGWTGITSAVYSNEAIVFENTDGEYCIADENGEIIVTEYAYIEAFSNDIATACIGKSEKDPDAQWVYINKNNERILETILEP